MNTFIIKNGLKLLKKHLFQTVIMIILAFLCLYILGVAMGSSKASHTAENKFKETYGNKTLYYTSEMLSDSIYYNYCEESGRVNFDKLHNFLEKLYQADDFSFVTLSRQAVQITSQSVQEQFLYGYEYGHASDSIVEYNGETLYSAKSIQVSSKFFETFSVSVSEGRNFEANDYILGDEDKLPALLGASYKESFKINDTFDAYYMGKKFKFFVIGFLSDDAFFFERAKGDMESCERYIILPSIYSDSADDFARITLLSHVNGFISSSLGYEKTSKMYEDYLESEGIGNWEISLMYKGAFNRENVLDKYSAMTNEVSKQFELIVIIVICFSVIVNVVVLCSMLRENFQTFCIELLCGASLKNIILESSVSVMMIMLISDLLASSFLIVYGHSVSSIILVQLAVLGIILFSCVICGIYVRQMKLNTYIGGKE